MLVLPRELSLFLTTPTATSVPIPRTSKYRPTGDEIAPFPSNRGTLPHSSQDIYHDVLWFPLSDMNLSSPSLFLAPTLLGPLSPPPPILPTPQDSWC